jgi:hypothetical protein
VLALDLVSVIWHPISNFFPLLLASSNHNIMYVGNVCKSVNDFATWFHN